MNNASSPCVVSTLTKFAFAIVATTFAFGSSQAAVYDIGADGNWTDAATWNPNIIGGPTTSDSVSITSISGNKSVYLNGANDATYTISELYFNESDSVGIGALSGSGSKHLNITGDLTKTGVGTLQFDGQNPSISVNIGGNLTLSQGLLYFGHPTNGFADLTVAGTATIASGTTMYLTTFATASFGATTLNGALEYRTIYHHQPSLNFAGLSGSGSITVPIDTNHNAEKITPINFTPSAGNHVFTGDISENAGFQKFAFNKGGAGTQVLSGTNVYTGPTTISQGTLQFGKRVSLYNADTASWNSSKISVSTGATIGFNVGGTGEFTATDLNTLKTLGATSGGSTLRLDTTNANSGFVYGGVIADYSGSSALRLDKAGANTFTVTAANTYTGGTIVSAGTMLVNNTTGSGTGTGNVSVASGAVLGGTGAISGSVTVNTGGSLMGGEGLASGDLEISGDVSLADGSFIKLTLGTGQSHSSLTRTGGIWSFDSDQAFTFLGVGAVGTYDNLISGLTGSEVGLGTIGQWTITNNGWLGTFSYDNAGGVDLTLTAIPEPSTWALVGLAGLVLTTLRARRKLA